MCPVENKCACVNHLMTKYINLQLQPYQPFTGMLLLLISNQWSRRLPFYQIKMPVLETTNNLLLLLYLAALCKNEQLQTG